MAIIMQNHPEFIETMVAASIIGAIFVPIDPRTKGHKLKYMLEFSECRGVICADYVCGNLESCGALSSLPWTIVVTTGLDMTPFQNSVLYSELMLSPFVELLIETCHADAPMQLLYTSGTTGDPKAIISPHWRFCAALPLGELLQLSKDDKLYTGLSLTHANAQLVTLGLSLNLGLPSVFSRKFTQSRIWDIVRTYECTVFNLLGGMTTAIYAMPEEENDQDNPVRLVLSAGMPAAIWEEFSSRFGVEICESYGAAEGGMTSNFFGQGPVGSCGRVIPNLSMRIDDEEYNEVEAGKAGQICFKNADQTPVTVNYFKNEEASKSKTRNGWLLMGDIGHVDDNGWLFFHHRDGSGIRRNGDFIDPRSIEKILANDPAIKDVYVYGIPAASGAPGEQDVVAAVVPSDPRKFSTKYIFALCRAELESNFIPSYLQVLDQIPKTASEKPQERFLLEHFNLNPEMVFSRG